MFSLIVIHRSSEKIQLLRTMTLSFTILRFFSHFLGPTEDIPVKVTGNVKNGFTAEFVPIEVGIHMILVEYNGVAVGGTPYYSKAYDSESVGVSDIPKTAAGKTVTFAGKSNKYIFLFLGYAASHNP